MLEPADGDTRHNALSPSLSPEEATISSPCAKSCPTFLGALLLAVAGCGTPARWEKAGVSDADDGDRRHRLPPVGLTGVVLCPTPYTTPPGPIGSSGCSSATSERFYAENRLTAFCMRNKGYELMPIPKTPG